MDMSPNRAPVSQPAAIDRIAAVLGCSTDDFSRASEAHPLANAAELMRLWSAITNAADRERVLACARVVMVLQNDRLAAMPAADEGVRR